ncbi:DUF6944 family repetitive protein [Fictibacillus terranigra]|uniref:Uncharacterized protein n=1 Tax=Fictibacillus terranigra TaxID=3058424 RepID=A0ABT8E2G4_9BACL|nr:hypothetical protein [Fictibacillus sp. CENA-BCM004]MDN4072096.1 hypothetical protein [Fictibacillus sp. CENA-BCM004]
MLSDHHAFNVACFTVLCGNLAVCLIFVNTLQAAGNSLEAGGQGTFSLELIGNELQAIGNVTVIAGLLMDFEGDIEDILIITGNWTQALGGLVALADEFEDSTTAGQSENIIGNLLQAIGNSLQALGGSYELLEDGGYYHPSVFFDNDDLIITGSWIQAAGAAISVIGQIKEETQEAALNINE